MSCADALPRRWRDSTPSRLSRASANRGATTFAAEPYSHHARTPLGKESTVAHYREYGRNNIRSRTIHLCSHILTLLHYVRAPGLDIESTFELSR